MAHDYERAIADCNKAIRLDPKYTTAYSIRATVYLAKGDSAEAINDFSKAISLDAKYTTAYQCRALAYKMKGQYEKAVSDFTAAIDSDPNPSAAYLGRAGVYLEKKDYTTALADLSEALKADRSNSEVYKTLAWTLATCPTKSVRDGKKAIVFARRACELTGWEDPYCLGTLAAASAEAADFEEAVKWEKKALEVPEIFGKEGLRNEQARLGLYQNGKAYHEE